MGAKRRGLRAARWAVLGPLSLAGCGGEAAPPSPERVAQCLRDGGASVELDPRVSERAGTPGFEPVLAPFTKVAVRARFSGGAKATLHVSTPATADAAERRARDYLELFGLGRDHLVRRGNALLLLPSASMPAPARDRARRCMD